MSGWGRQRKVGLLTDRDVILSVRRDERQNIKATTVLTTPVPAPIGTGHLWRPLKYRFQPPDVTVPFIGSNAC